MFKLLLNLFSLSLFIKSIFGKTISDKAFYCVAGWIIYFTAVSI